ncbi:MAG: transglutaminase domain-containing protein [Flavobacterium sp.]
MKIRIYIFLILLLFSISNYSQIKNFEEIEKYVKEVPKSETIDIETLTKYLKKDAKTKKEIVARIYFWIAENIEYDWDAFINKRQIDVSANATLENRKSVCAGYASLFKSICDNAKIKCVIIEGYAKGYGYNGERLTETNHAWNAVKLYDKWEFVDSTWGNGSILINSNEEKSWSARYLFDDPNDFILEHFPKSEEWQLLENKMNIETFFSEEMEKKRKIRTGVIEE